MRALFIVKHPGALRLLESTLRLLSERGHAVDVRFEGATGTPEALSLAQRLASDCAGLSVGHAPKIPKNGATALARRVRLGIDYLRYLEPRYADAPKLRARAEIRAPQAVVRAARRGGPAGRRVLAAALTRIERSLPAPATAVEFIRAHDPDVVLATPLVGMGATQADFVRAARELGVRTAFPVLSWDNLTNKGLLRDVPDLVLVWNEAQADEVVELHGVPRTNVAVTGAATFDHWFRWQPSRTREELCAEAGLRSDRPYLLYLGSSPFIAEDEASSVASWIERLRECGGALAEVGIFVRPHPQNAETWEGFTTPEQVAVWPRGGEDPLHDGARRNYFDSMYHAAGVVGINTTALIESAIARKPVLALPDERYRATQEGTLHFHHLVGDSGLLHVSRSFGEHAAALERVLAGEAPVESEAFLRRFVRPNGLERPATPFVVDALERLAAEPPPRPRGRSRAGRALARSVAGRSPTARRVEEATSPVKEAKLAVHRIGLTDGPVIAGPWVSEVGHELLYWIPFLHWACEREPGLAERLVAVSRGGVADWYAGVSGGGYVDLYDLVDADVLRRHVVEAGPRKQMREVPFDAELVALAERHAGLERAVVLHPATMFGPYWRLLKERGIHRHGGMFELRPLPRPPIPPELEGRLPRRFVAARFYFNASFPDTPANRAAATAVLASVADKTEVVSLDPRFRFDDHRDLALDESRFVHVDDLLNPSTNLAIQTAVLSRAEAFVGTYGGLSYVAPLLGLPSLALYSDAARFRAHHLELANRAFRRPPFGRLVALDVCELELVRLVASAAAVLPR